MKTFIRGMKTLSDGRVSPFAANMIGNLKDWQDNEAETRALNEILPGLDCNEIIGKN